MKRLALNSGVLKDLPDLPPNVVFQSWFPVQFSLEREAPGLYARLMLRNRDLHWSSWSMDIGGSVEACLYVAASLPTESLNSRLFARVCQEIAGEINAFHGELRSRFQFGVGQVAADPRYSVRQEVRGGVPMRQGDNLPVRRDDTHAGGVWYLQ